MLERVNYPQDLKSLSIAELNELATEIRSTIAETVEEHGGHYGPNLGFVEATIALHYVFNSPIDKFVFDVSHQVYPHKMLTGRKEKFTNPDAYYKYSGYTNPNESEHDFFTVGHTSTSVSLATGMAKARDLKGETGNIIAIIGDGSMSGGEAFEGLNNAVELGTNFIVLFNDNDQSIAPNYGGMYKGFKELRDNNGVAENNFFKAMGLDYKYVADGHNIEELIKAFEEVKDIDHPIVLHVHTIKGKGVKAAEEDREANHYIMSREFNAQDFTGYEGYDEIAASFVLDKIKKDKTVIAICPAVPGAVGWTPARRAEAGAQYVDTGIAEEHAIAFAAGLAKNGAKPVVFDGATFLQRTYDQLSQDLSLNSNPAVILSFPFGGGISGMDATHSSAFDMAMMGSIPNLVLLSPSTKQEFLDMLDWAIEQTEHPVCIRVPGAVDKSEDVVRFDGKLTSQIVKAGSKVAVVGVGNFLARGREVVKALAANGIDASLVNPRVVSEVDVQTFESLKANHELVVVLEDGVLDGGYAEKVARFFGPTDVKVLPLGEIKEVTDRTPVAELYTRYGLDVDQVVARVQEILK